MNASLWGSIMVSASLVAGPAGAGLGKAEFNWTGNVGYQVSDLLTYDDTLSAVAAQGEWYRDFNIGIDDLAGTCRAPSCGLMGTFDRVVAGVVVLESLVVAFNAVDLNWVMPVTLNTGMRVRGLRRQFHLGHGGKPPPQAHRALRREFELIDAGVPTFLEPVQLPEVPAPAPLAFLTSGLVALTVVRRTGTQRGTA